MYLPIIALLALASSVSTNHIPTKGLPGNLQLLEYLQNNRGAPGILTTSFGYPVSASEAYNGTRRDSNLFSAFALEQLSSFSLERIPPRGVHAYGAGAKGYFKVTKDVTHITNAKVFNKVGKVTPLLARFSIATGDIGCNELLNRAKSLSIKLYTEEGNMDLTGSVPSTFSVKDPADVLALTHALRPNSKTGVVDDNAIWDFMVNCPEAVLTAIQSATSTGQPKSFSHMNIFAVHTYQVENAAGKVSFVRFNWFGDAGTASLNDTEYATLAATRPDYYTETLYNDISAGNYPTFTLYMQVIAQKDLPKMKFDIFDTTLYWPEEDFPNIEIGKIVLDKHVDNHFAEIEQSAFNPMNLPPGIRGTDKLFYARSFMYRDGQIHRLGTGFNKIPVNCPISGAKTYNRDGNPPLGDNGGSAPNYYPNSFNGLVPTNRVEAPLYRPNTVPYCTNYWQIAKYYNDLPQDDQERMVRNLGRLFATLNPMVRTKVMEIFIKSDQCLADKLQQTINVTLKALAAQAAKTPSA